MNAKQTEQTTEAGDQGDEGTADVGATNASGPVCVEYLGFGPSIIDFANGEKFRSIVRKHGYQLVLEDQEVTGVEVLDIGQPLTQPSRLWLKDPATGASLAVLYDDSYDSWLESPGFIEILQLMDEHSKEHFQSRLFVYTPGYDSDDEDPSVEEGHRCYELGYDFTTGEYKE